jgi:integrase
MGRRKRGERVLGPYDLGDGRWRIIHVNAAGERVPVHFASEAQARAKAAEARRELRDEGRTVGAAIAGYLADLGSRTTRLTVDNFEAHIKKLFLGEEDRVVTAVTPALARDWYERLTRLTNRRRVRDAGGWPLLGADGRQLYEEQALSPTTHHKALARGRAVFQWAVERGWIRSNPFATVRPIGRARRGKLQHHRDEARRFFDACLRLAVAGDQSATVLATQLLLGCRPSEITDRRVRDLDNGGRTLVIDYGKTDAAARRLALPPVIQPVLLALAGDRPAEDYLFSRCRGDGTLIKAIERVCRAAGLPRIVPYSLRGTHSSLAVEEGATSAIVARALGHTSAVMTETHYIRPGLVSETTRARAQAELLSSETISAVPFPPLAGERNG